MMFRTLKNPAMILWNGLTITEFQSPTCEYTFADVHFPGPDSTSYAPIEINETFYCR
jgi:hypothetical protein